MRQFDVAVVIGRFQPFHNGHKYLLEQALLLAEKVVVLVGSANKAVNIKNPFTFEERKNMIEAVFSCKGETTAEINSCSINRISIRALKDFAYNDEQWVGEVQRIVNEELDGTTRRCVLIGHNKDNSSYYLKMFPQWELKEMEYHNTLNATDMRNILFSGHSADYIKGVVPKEVFEVIQDFFISGKMDNLSEEYRFVLDYKKQWANSPYPPTFLTCDAVVIQQGHVLTIRRGAMPGKGLRALPGGFVNGNETIREAAIRELREETKLRVPEPVLRGSIVAQKVFDDPSRSLRGRTVTQAFLIHLTNIDQGLPKVKGADDAAHAEWVPLAELKEEEFYEDHYQIIQDMVGML